MTHNKKSSCAVLFTLVCVTGVLFSAASLSTMFFINLRALSNERIETLVHEQIAHLRSQVAYNLQQHTDILHHAAAGIADILHYGGYVPFQEMRGFLDRLSETDPNMGLLYFSNNYPWNSQEGYYINDGWIPPEDWNNTKRPWFTDAKKAAGKVAYMEPYRDSSTGEMVASLSAAVFDGQRRDIGVIAADVFITDWAKLLEENKAAPGQRLFLLNGKGLFITHADPSMVMAADFFTETNMEPYRGAVLGSPAFSLITKDTFIYSTSIPQTGWILVSTVPVSVIFAKTDRLLARTVLISLALLAAATVITALFTRSMIVRPIRDIQKTALSLADMNFNIAAKDFRNDEIGDIQRALLLIRDNLHRALDELKGHLGDMTDTGDRLNSVVSESSDALEKITGDMDAMKQDADEQLRSVSQTSGEVEEIAKSIDVLENAVHTQSAHIAESSGAIEEMVANIASIKAVAVNVEKTAGGISASSSAGHAMLLKLAEEVKQIQEQSAALQNANKTISDIAAQTNILAMNAAIEAAHAGESGRGFAVVASEIRKLAELSGKESDRISSEIKKMEREIGRISEASHETVGSMDRMFTEIKAMNESFAALAAAVEEQAEGGGQILTALKTIQDATGQVRNGAGAIHRRSGSIRREMEKLRQISEAVTRRAHAVQDTSGNIASFLERARPLRPLRGF
ncbi:MAG: methyl-accepting chemotaxis protein [Spirochaetaceae bacterium]|jgi:methyl-accepting chemotaxis protein|nr:methyl-accepting chemotaxis protein [Spirochaetaceae bacterium]